MKRFLLTFSLLALAAIYAQLQAQCTVSQLAVQIHSVVPDPGGAGCTITFDLSWDQEINAGNKYAYVHLWTTANYHTPTALWPTTGNKVIYSAPTLYPKTAELANTLTNFVIENNNTLTPTLGTTYWPSPGPPSIPVNTSATIQKTQISAAVERVTLGNISLHFMNCSVPVTLQGDIWASQAENKSNVHCAYQGLAFGLNDPRVTGFKRCTEPRTYDISISTAGTTPFSVYYNLYTDDGDAVFEPDANDVLIDTKLNLTISATSPYTAQNVSYPGNGTEGEQSSLWVEVRKTGNGYSTLAYFDNQCAPLPVTFYSFDAVRNRHNVLLTWKTASEQNNKGFNVQRNSRGIWETIAFVATGADGGNSNELLAYAYTDINNEKGITQYRVQQVDFDGWGSYSVVRSVKGMEQASAIVVYPNPSPDGKVWVIFEDGSYKEILISDMTGRLVRHYRKVVNSLEIEGLENGIYHILVNDILSKVSSTEKLVIRR